MDPASAALDHHLARGLLRNAVTWLELEAESGRRHAWRAREIGAVAILGGFGGLAGRAERLLAEAGAVEVDDEHSSSDPSLPHGAELSEMFPPYDGELIHRRVSRAAPKHIVFALELRWDEAWAACEDDAHREEVAAIRALLNDFDGALEMIVRPEFAVGRRVGPLMVTAIESMRAGDSKRARKLVLEQLGSEDGLDWWVPVAAGLLGRVPWDGYPLPES